MSPKEVSSKTDMSAVVNDANHQRLTLLLAAYLGARAQSLLPVFDSGVWSPFERYTKLIPAVFPPIISYIPYFINATHRILNNHHQ